MVALDIVRAANSRVGATLPAGLTAVFAGATAGIGEIALKSFVKYTKAPKVYFIGRSQEAGDRIQGELKVLNADGRYIFIKTDLSLMKNVDEVCRKIKETETAINVLFTSQGTVNFSGDTSEGLRYILAVSYYSRLRMALNLLPLLKAAHSLRRIVSPMCAGFEGKLYLDHLGDGKVPLRDSRPHLATQMTLALEALARMFPTVAFIHNFPGAVKTNLIRPEDGVMMRMLNVWFRFTLRNQWVPFEEVGQRHTWLCTSAAYPSRQGNESNGVGGLDVQEVVKGSDGTKGSGVYTVDVEGNSSGDGVVKVLEKYRYEGAVDSVWKDIESKFKRITGRVSISE